MRIAFVGKGGSGKTTLATAYSVWSNAQHPTLMIDADINQHLVLAFEKRQEAKGKNLNAQINALKEYLAGDNPHYQNEKHLIKTSPPGSGSRLMTLKSQEANDYFIKLNENFFLAPIGEPENEDTGLKCYHAKVGAAEILLNHLNDRSDERIIVDMTAGADAFASGMFARFDVTIFVVEPTEKSLEVYRQYTERAKPYNITIAAVGNKIMSQNDERFLQERLGEAYLGGVTMSPTLRDSTWNTILSDGPESLKIILKKIEVFAGLHPRDWQKMQEHSWNFHRLNKEWVQQKLGINVEDQIDTTFRYE